MSNSLKPINDAGRPKLGRPRSDGRPPVHRDDILRAAQKLFSENGYSGTSIRALARALDIHATSIFHHFPTKEAILETLIDMAFGTERDFFRGLSELPVPPDVALYKAVYEDVQYCHSGIKAMPFQSIMLLPELRGHSALKAPRYWEEMTAYYEDWLCLGQREGLLIPHTARAAAEGLLALGVTAIVSFTRDRLGAPPDLARSLSEIALRGLLVDPKRLPEIADAADAIELKLPRR